MNSKISKITALITVSVFTAACIGSSTVYTPSSVAEIRSSLPVSVSVSDTVSMDETVSGFELLKKAVDSDNADSIAVLCEDLRSKISEELELSESSGRSEIIVSDPVLSERQRKYESEVRIKAERAINSINSIENGINVSDNIEKLYEIFGYADQNAKSHAASSSAERISVPELQDVTASESSILIDDTNRSEYDLSALINTDTVPVSVSKLAKDLGSAEAIYNYLRNSISYEAYAGSKKGAYLTIEQMSGNDVDQTVLLVSMLRSAGIPSLYVSGTVEITSEQAIAVTGADSAESAGRILMSRYNGVRGITQNGKLTGYRMDHVWCEACVPYTDYRGSGNRSGESIWIPLDVSFKELKVESETRELNYDEAALEKRALYKSYAEEYPKIYNNCDFSNTLTVYSRSIVNKEDEYLSNTLPYEVVNIKNRYSELSEEYKDRLALQINGEILFDKELADLYMKPVTVSYEPATDEDRKIFEKYNNITEVPAYLLNVIPVVKVENEVFKGKKSVSLGSLQKMNTILKDSGGTKIIEDDLYSGSLYAVNLNYQMIGTDDAECAYARLCDIKNKSENGQCSTDEVILGLLDYTGKYYFCLCDHDAALYEKIYDVKRCRQLGIVITGYEFVPEKTLGIVNSLKSGSFFMDVTHNSFNTVSYHGNKSDEIGFNMALAVSESQYEGTVWGILTDNELSGVSTVSVFKAAEDNDIAARYICTSDDFEMLDSFNISSTVKSEIKDYVNQKLMVSVIPETLNIGEWKGTGYIVIDTESGACSYMISGDKSGGHTDPIEYLYNWNMVIFKVTMAITATTMTQDTLKLYFTTGGNQLSAAWNLIKSGKAIADAMNMYFDTIDFVYECAVGGDEAIKRFADFTAQNMENLMSTLLNIYVGAGLDIISVIGEVGDLVSTGLSAVKAVGEQGYELYQGIQNDDIYDEDWLEDYSYNAFEATLDHIISLIGHLL